MSTTVLAPTPPAVKSRLSVMMFLQYAIWGAWLPLLWPFLALQPVDANGKVAWCWLSDSPGDEPPYDEVMKATESLAQTS